MNLLDYLNHWMFVLTGHDMEPFGWFAMALLPVVVIYVCIRQVQIDKQRADDAR